MTDILEALQVLEHLLDDPVNGNVCMMSLSLLPGCPWRPIGEVPGTTEVSPKLQFPVEPLVKYLQDKHGLSQEGVPC